MEKFKAVTRCEMYLAKIAGRSVDLTTLTPPVVTDATEEMFLEIASRISDAEKAPAAATTAKAGIVKQAANVSTAAGEAPTATEFNNLISALIAAGIMAAPSE